MGFTSILSFAHQLVQARVQPGDTVIDATAGNGNDTLFLSRLVAGSGTVYSVDIQEAALWATQERLARDFPEFPGVVLIHGSHADLLALVPPQLHGQIAAVMFNLGYLPGQDHAVITRTESTIPALEAALKLLRPGGVLTIVVYPGHPGGDTEAEAVADWASSLPQKQYQALKYQFMNQVNKPPYVLAVEVR
ncbi:tRNA (mnm(5)s(2)U34)-methyltransferase [Paenibacillus sp. y28]|uniref:tRNA (mnm(5)s(2)U34)-methyltransferase n=1 Tax=Paenibacillus sp. y28 TaxID=3129110 RepID=UPI00301A9922